MKEMRVLAVRLFLITAIAGLVLAVANSFTAPVIAEQKAQKLAESLREVYSDAEEFDRLEDQEMADIIGENEAVKEIFTAKSSGEPIGYIFRSLGKGGFGGKIEFIVAVSNDEEIKGFKVLAHEETPGFGKQCEEAFFEDGVAGNKIDQDLTAAESPSTDYDIQAISGSTITTTAILNGLNDTLMIARELVN
ncbi:MAG: RnfABCDGE type electron transport complex subunit G [Tissierellia bacterium]|nr:RnfABCDGE type electron transport complex subunit G [Tissierellia bacterium]